MRTFSLSSQQPCVGIDDTAVQARGGRYLVDLGHRHDTGIRKYNDCAEASVADYP